MRYFLVLVLLTLVIGCGQKPQKDNNQISDSTLTIATFNIEWLGDGIDDRKERTEEDYKRIAEAIIETKADLIGIQEIENPNALKAVMNYLPGYSYKLGENGWLLNLGVIYKNDVEVSNPDEYMPLIVKKDRTRPGFTVDVKKGNFDFKLMVVHFKSTSRYDDTPEKKQASYDLRNLQSQAVINWIDSVYANTTEKDLIVLGDYNDNPNRGEEKSQVLILENRDDFSFLTADMESCRKKYFDVIDHIAVTESAKSRYLENSNRMYPLYDIYLEEEADMISDHCPVIATFDVKMPDND